MADSPTQQNSDPPSSANALLSGKPFFDQSRFLAARMCPVPLPGLGTAEDGCRFSSSLRDQCELRDAQQIPDVATMLAALSSSLSLGAVGLLRWQKLHVICDLYNNTSSLNRKFVHDGKHVALLPKQR